jgi:hypothetical protein
MENRPILRLGLVKTRVSVGWWAESDGTDYIDSGGIQKKNTVRGDLFRIHEWYMCKKGEDNKGLMLTRP